MWHPFRKNGSLIGALRIGWHEVTCPLARAGMATCRNTDAGRIYDCPCDFGIWEAR